MHKHILPDYVKPCPSCMNIENLKKGKVTTRKSLLLKSCMILDFYSEYYIPEIEKLAFHLPRVYILGGNNCAGKIHDIFVNRHNKFYCKCTCAYAERCQVLSEQVHSQYFSGCESLSMEVVPLDPLNKFKLSTIPMAQFCSCLSGENDQYASNTATRIRILHQFIITKQRISPYLTTVWDHTDG